MPDHNKKTEKSQKPSPITIPTNNPGQWKAKQKNPMNNPPNTPEGKFEPPSQRPNTPDNTETTTHFKIKKQ